jgi:hypothetical protein
VGLPTIEKAWQFSHQSNTPSGSLQTDLANIFILAKNALKAFGSNPWTCKGSSDGSTAGLDGVDRLSATNKIVGASATWIVMRNAVLGCEFMYAFNSNIAEQGTMLFSPAAGFTGGSTSAAPTATDSKTLLGIGRWAGSNVSTGGQYRAHVMQSTDGECTRVFFCTASLVVGWWQFEKPGNVPAGWAAPVVGAARSVGSAAPPTDATLLNCSAMLGQAIYSAQGPAGGGAGTTMPLTISYEETGAGNSSVINQVVNEIDGSTHLGPVGLWHGTTAGQRGRHGYIRDMYFTGTGSVTGDTFPADGSKQFVQMGQMVVPGDGTAWLIS